MNKKLVVVFLLFLAVNCQLKETLFHSINGMLGPEPGVDHLVNWGAIWGTHYMANTDPSGLHAHFPVQVQLPHIGWNVNPYDKFVPLLFGSWAKVSTLTYRNEINVGGGGFVLASAHHGFRQGTSVSMITGYGIAMVSPKQQFNQVPVQKCHRSLFSKKCHWEIVNVPRGFHLHEIEAITQTAMRRASVSMRQSLGFGTAPSKAPENLASLGLSFVDEHAKLRALYPEIEYVWTDVATVEIPQWNDAFYHTMRGLGDQGIRDRMWQFLAAHQHSNFLYAATANILLYVIVHKNDASSFNLHVSIFTVGGGSRLPIGAFATSVGGWSLERGGENANPSIHQIMGIFGFN